MLFGVGVSLVLASDNVTFKVADIDKESSLRIGGAVRKGDRLIGVDANGSSTYENVVGATFARVRSLLLGPEGSHVSLQMQRRISGSRTWQTFGVRLIRRVASEAESSNSPSQVDRASMPGIFSASAMDVGTPPRTMYDDDDDDAGTPPRTFNDEHQDFPPPRRSPDADETIRVLHDRLREAEAAAGRRERELQEKMAEREAQWRQKLAEAELRLADKTANSSPERRLHREIANLEEQLVATRQANGQLLQQMVVLERRESSANERFREALDQLEQARVDLDAARRQIASQEVQMSQMTTEVLSPNARAHFEKQIMILTEQLKQTEGVLRHKEER